MLLIDRYLLRQFVQNFVIFFLSLMGLFTVVDAFANMEDFLSIASKQGSLLAVLGEYYGYRALAFFDSSSAIVALIAAMFTVSSFQRNNEMTALQAAGVPKRRIVKSILGAAIAVSLLAVLSRELVIPTFRDKFTRNAQDLNGAMGRSFEPAYDQETSVFFRGKLAFLRDRRIQEPAFRLPPDLARYGSQLTAEKAIYEPPKDDRPGGYRLMNVKSPHDLQKKASLANSAGQAIILTPADHDWLKPGECFVVSNLNFEQLASASGWRRYSSTWQLIAGLRDPSFEFGADARVTIHARLVQPVLDLCLLFLGLPLILTRETRNPFLATGMCVAVAAMFLLVVMACQTLGSSLIVSPVVAAWSPLVLFVPAATYMAEPLLE